MKMIKIFTDKKTNFLMILYQIIKKQNLFEHLNLKINHDLGDKERKEIKSMLRSKENISKLLKQNKKLNEIYQENRNIWENYWDKNISKLKKTKTELIKRMKNFEKDKLNQLEYFFKTRPPKIIKVNICMGNNYPHGTGNSFSPNLIFIFPRQFGKSNKKSLDKDFAMLIHEFVHLYQPDLCSKNKEFIEIVARAFAPKGVLLNRNIVDENSIEGKFTLLIEKAINDRKTYVEIKKELLTLHRNF